MEPYTRRHSKLRNIIPNRTRVVRNANKTLKRRNASRYLIPKHPKEFRWLNSYNVPLTTTSSNSNELLSENEQAFANEYNANLTNSRRSVPRANIQIGRPHLSPNLARKMAGIMEQHNDPVNIKRAIHANTNLNARGRQTLGEYLAYLYQDMNLAAPPREKRRNVTLTPKLTRIYDYLSTQYTGPEFMYEAFYAIPNLTQGELNSLIDHLLFMHQDQLT
jgi:hypothetical protein